jgi:anti-sigma28 factor (negative regulator of flagellin synthesis)
MKIDQSNLQSGAGVGGTQQGGQVQGVGGGGLSGRGLRGYGSDSVQLSNLSEALRSYTTPSPQRAAAIDALGKDVRGGRYTIDAQAVSRGIISEAFLQ